MENNRWVQYTKKLTKKLCGYIITHKFTRKNNKAGALHPPFLRIRKGAKNVNTIFKNRVIAWKRGNG